MSDKITRAEALDEVSKWTVGLGMLTMALAPLSIPILALTAVALIPLALPLVALALLGGIVAAPVLLVRGIVRRVRGAPRARRVHEPARVTTSSLG